MAACQELSKISKLCQGFFITHEPDRRVFFGVLLHGNPWVIELRGVLWYLSKEQLAPDAYLDDLL
jgi:hypothetical protein